MTAEETKQRINKLESNADRCYLIGYLDALQKWCEPRKFDEAMDYIFRLLDK